ncbi:MAG: thiolase family protein [Candidatus Methanolliviera hydrocarbonicum]|uniref:Thiolase family protein n=1 Tax=Candidatus Methanolliviera hydrocarbonicum TaxID=2491085 RepID=A0A520KVY6_9EURY|nr:MAG: thiolase family protein [Candidatus Methanolliviera hydrocarbonicum]
MVRNVAIVGIGQTKCGRRSDVTLSELVYEATKKGLEDAKLMNKEIDAVVCGSMPGYQCGINDSQYYIVDGLGGFSKPVIRIATCGSTGGSVFHSAYYHVASGLFDIVLAVGHEKMSEGDSQGVMSNVTDPFIQRPFLGGAPGVFALQFSQYESRYNISHERARAATAEISVRNHLAAFDNPYAHLKIKCTIEDVLKSQMLCYPIRMLDCCPSSDGACAIILASEEKAKKITDNPVWVKGLGYAGDEQWLGDKDFVEWLSPITASRRAYKMAGIEDPGKELDVAEVYNPFTWQELLWYEQFGFCGKGEGIKMVEDGMTEKDGDMPIAPSGGTLCTNPIGATGMQRVAEAAMQVRGTAGKHQVKGAETGFASAMGGVVQYTAVTVVSKNL